LSGSEKSREIVLALNELLQLFFTKSREPSNNFVELLHRPPFTFHFIHVMGIDIGKRHAENLVHEIYCKRTEVSDVVTKLDCLQYGQHLAHHASTKSNGSHLR